MALVDTEPFPAHIRGLRAVVPGLSAANGSPRRAHASRGIQSDTVRNGNPDASPDIHPVADGNSE